MIEEISGLPPGTLGFKATGKVTGEDYDRVLTPVIDAAIRDYEQIKLLCQLGPGIEGYSLDAAWDDAKLGLRHWSGFERIACVTDAGWIKAVVRAIGFMMPCPIQIFDIEQLEDARRWLEESLGSFHLSMDGNVLTARLLGKLEPGLYDHVNDEVDQLMSSSRDVRLILDLREFTGWTGLSALSNHLSLIREHRRVPVRVAVVGDKVWQHAAEKVMARFVDAKTKFFDGDDYAGAAAWVAS